LNLSNTSTTLNAPALSTPPIPQNLLFDSTRTAQNFYDGFGREDWDIQKHQLTGAKGEGKWSFTDNIFTIYRDNTAGRFIIEIKQYFYQSRSINIVPSNIYGRNPRHFKVTFKARAVSGSHEITVAFRDFKTKDWINELTFEVTNTEFRPLLTSVAIGADKQFTIEIHTWCDGPQTVLQIADFIVEEVV